eukprot:gnl/MRDRNA2_/MRDRNA2_102959_c0_seq1.p1 gnl/MRDRNA2_/MRDRNA2_102959_c0~~gnl/MRDRNA2_/MRDRNA2_102959_c0_seq1.p1  ORF type:complete len:318 (-),score=46.82 gnl/MRDRNA2_/MRDRNA2_102959_c0_seq1:125-1078(-)
MMPNNSCANDDDKYAKFAAKNSKPAGKQIGEPLDKYHNALGLVNFQTVPVHFFLFACFVLASGFAFTYVGGEFNVNLTERFAALQLEILGLLMLRHKIASRKSVSGISGMTIVMYTVVYTFRIGLALPYGQSSDGFFQMNWDVQLKDLDFDTTLGFCSLLIVLDILRKIFVTYCDTYEAELDVLKAWYLIPACWTVSLLIRPHFASWPFLYGYSWSSTLNMDVLALMPQVVMMAQSGGKVATPIANFVAATAISRCGDVFHSIVCLREVARAEPFSFWTAVIVQIVHLVLVADFMYYFCKAKAWARKEEDVFVLAEV